jgi:hypothetical protein
MLRRLIARLGGRFPKDDPAGRPDPLSGLNSALADLDQTILRVSSGATEADAEHDHARESFLSQAAAFLDAPALRLVRLALAGDRNSWALHRQLAHVKTLAPDDLAPMFAALMTLRDTMDWVPLIPARFPLVGETWSATDPCQIVLMTAETTLTSLCEVGFKPNAAQAAPVLRFLLATPCVQLPRDMVSDSLSLQILRRLNMAFHTHTDLPENARPLAIALAERARPAIADNTVLPPKARALIALAGLHRDGLLHRMQRQRPPRLGSADFHGRISTALPTLACIAAATDALIDEFTAAGGKPDWLLSEQDYTRRFGTAGAAFGWWLQDRPPRAEPGQFHRESYAAMCRDSAFAARENWVQAVRTLVSADENHLPFTFGTERLPDPDAFTFEGADPDGWFLDHLATATLARPPRGWLKITEGHIARIGPARVANGFARWLGHAKDIADQSLPFVLPADQIPRAAKALSDQLPWTGSGMPVPDLDDLMLNRLALRNMLAEATEGKAWSGPPQTGGIGLRQHRLHLGPMPENNVAVMTGVFWASARLGPAAPLASIASAATFCFAKPHGEFRSRKAGNAALWALGHLGTPEAVHALARIRRGVARDKAISAEVDKALSEAGRAAGLDLDDMLELSVQDWGIGPGGFRQERLGDWAVTLRVASTRSTVIESRPWDRSDATPKRGIPKAALADTEAQQIAEELKAATVDIPKLLREARARLDLSICKDRSWAWPDWWERFLDNALIATLSQRVIWFVEWPDKDRAAVIWHQGGFQDVTGARLEKPVDAARLRIWHTLLAGTSDAIDWADRLAALGIRQPFPQAWRPVYQITAPERETRSYSNRFAGHILHQPAFVAVLRQRGWRAHSQQAFMQGRPEASNHIELPAFGLRAQFWAAGVGPFGPSGHDYGGAAFDYVITDRVVFFADAATDAPLDLEAIPAIAFSEVMRDVELAVGIASIGRDQYWADGGSEAPHPANRIDGAEAYRMSFARRGSAELVAARHRALARFLPGLDIGARARLSPTEVEVTGTSGKTYTIHLGSAAVHLLPGRRHLCIVPGRMGVLDHSPLPFEGDAILAEILSKLFLLADDSRISIPHIRQQIGL